jgi:multidrug transporter EmrE-like cation transporter
MSIFTVVPAILWLIFSGIIFAFAEYSSKEFGLSPSVFWAASAIFFYALCALVWLPAIYQKQDLSTTGALWTVIALITTVTIGLVVFGERPSITSFVGIAFGFVAVLLLSIG